MSVSTRAGDHIRRNAIAYVALFVALSGSSYAATKIASKDIKKNAVLAKHVKDGELTGADVADDGLTGVDIDEGTLNVLLGNGAVTTAKLADAAVTIPKLAFDPATQAELDAVAASTGSPPNNSLGAAEPPATDDQIADGTIDTQDLTDGSIVNADIGGGAAIDDSKLGTINDAGKVADTALSGNVARLDSNQTFSGNNSFDGDLTLNQGNSEDLAIDATRTGSDFFPPFSASLTNNTSSSIQRVASFSNSSGTGETEQIMSLTNFDNNSAVATGILLSAVNGGTMTTAIDASDLDIGTALDIGANDIKTNAATISSAELGELDGNPTRTLNLPLTSFLNVSDQVPIDFGASDGTAPDFIGLNSAFVIQFDNVAGAGADGDSIATSFIVPDDFSGFGQFVFRTSKSTGGGPVPERLSCRMSLNGAAIGSEGSTVITTSSSAAFTVTPAGAPVAGGSVGLACDVDDGANGLTYDDDVRIHAVAFQYESTR